MLVGVELEVEVGKSGEMVVTVAVAVAIAVPLDEALEEPCFRVPKNSADDDHDDHEEYDCKSKPEFAAPKTIDLLLFGKGFPPTPDAFSRWSTPGASDVGNS